MSSEAQVAVERVIDAMHRRMSEPLTIDEMSDIALFSKFHFSRIFLQATGVPPARYLGALRLVEAKRLLLETSLSVAAISLQVGYASVSTFGVRFKRGVGLAPRSFREGRGWRPYRAPGQTVRCRAGFSGVVRVPGGTEQTPVFLGLFPSPVFEGDPVRSVRLRAPGPFRLPNVPPGTWYMFAYAGASQAPRPATPVPLWTGLYGPVTVPSGSFFAKVELDLRHRRRVDPPMPGAMYAPNLCEQCCPVIVPSDGSRAIPSRVPFAGMGSASRSDR